MKTAQNQRQSDGSLQALRAGFTVEDLFHLTKSDRWFLVQIERIAAFDVELAAAKN